MTLDLDEPGFGNVCSKVNPRTVEGAREYSFICVDGSLELLVLSFAARLPREGKGKKITAMLRSAYEDGFLNFVFVFYAKERLLLKNIGLMLLIILNFLIFDEFTFNKLI